MIKDIVFLIEIPFSHWFYQRFGIERLMANGFRVTVIDCTAFTQPKYATLHQNNELLFDRHFIAFSKQDIVRIIFNLPATQSIIFDHLGYKPRSRSVKKIFLKAGFLRGKWCLGSMPLPPSDKLNLLKLFDAIKHKDIFSRAINRYFRWWSDQFSRPSLVVLAGSESCDASLAITPHKIWAHSFDYDEYLSIEEYCEPSIVKGDYLVFLDENIPDHPDYLHCGISSPISAKKYYTLLNRAFLSIENALGIPIVIGLHPKSSEPDISDSLFGRKTFRGQSALLVKYSKGVIGHASCSHSFAIMWRKSLLLLNCDELTDSFIGPFIEARAKYLDKPVLNISDFKYSASEICEAMSINENLYERYFDAFVKKKGTENDHLWDIVSGYVKNEFPEPK